MTRKGYTWTSHDIQNEILELMASRIRQQNLIEKFKRKNFKAARGIIAYLSDPDQPGSRAVSRARLRHQHTVITCRPLRSIRLAI